MAGLTLKAGHESLSSILTTRNDQENSVYSAVYSAGAFSLGYAEWEHNDGAAGTAGADYTGEGMSIAFNVNDNMSISYTTSDETYDTQDNAKTAVTTDDDVTESIDALQVAYSMGGMSIKAYNMEITNPDQDDDAADRSVTEIALGFAF